MSKRLVTKMMNEPTDTPGPDMVEPDADLARDLRALAHAGPRHAPFASDVRERLLQQARAQREGQATGRDQRDRRDRRGTPARGRSRPGPLRLSPSRRHRPLAVVIALAATLAVAGAAYAALSLVDEAMTVTPGLATVIDRYGRPLNLSRGACGYTMTVTRAYADANRVVVGYTLGGPPARHYVALKADWPLMTDARGVALRHVDMGMSRSMQEGTGGHFAAFDASAIASMTSEARPLRLHLTLPSVTMVERIDGGKPAVAPCETYTDQGMTIDDGRGGTIRVRDVTVDKPLSCDLTVPVDPALRAVAPRRTVSAAGGAVTLERVVVTRSEARLYLRADRPHLIQPDALVTLTVGGRAVQGNPVYGMTSGEGLAVFTVARPLYESAGEWTLTVRTNPYAQPKETGGPWVFRVAVPSEATR